MVLSFDFLCDHWNERFWVALSFGTGNYAVQSGSKFESAWNPKVWPLKWKLLSNFPVVLVIMLCKVVQTLESVDEFLWNNYASETSLV